MEAGRAGIVERTGTQGKPSKPADCDKTVTFLAAGARDGARPTLTGRPLSIEFPLLLPLASAALYAAAAILVKLAISRGADTWSVTFFSNLSMGLLFLPLALFGRDTWRMDAVPWGLGAGVLFFAGQIATFRSLSAGDVSIATPALASKVVFVALLSLLVPGNRTDPDLWLAVGMTMGGVLLLHRGPRHAASHPLATLGWALMAALVFAAADLLVQVGSPRAGFTLFMPAMFGTVALLSVVTLLPRVLRGGGLRAGRVAWRWGAAGIVLLAVQAAGMAAAIGLSGNATGVNVVYSSRGLWSLLLLALLARRLGVTEGALSPGTFALRAAGSLLILAAVVMVLV